MFNQFSSSKDWLRCILVVLAELYAVRFIIKNLQKLTVEYQESTFKI